MPEWSEEELAELGYELRIKITQDQEKKRWLLDRLAWRNHFRRKTVSTTPVRDNSPQLDSGKNTVVTYAAKKITMKTVRRRLQLQKIASANAKTQLQYPQKITITLEELGLI